MTDNPSEPTPEEQAAAGEKVVAETEGAAVPEVGPATEDTTRPDDAAVVSDEAAPPEGVVPEGDEGPPTEADAGGELDRFAAELAATVGSDSWTADNATVRVQVRREGWPAAVAAARDTLPFFAWLSGIDWSRDVTVGEPAENVAELEERFEVLCRLSTVTDGRGAILVAAVPKEDAWIDSIVDVFPGAGWHERETAEMFGIDFRGNPNLTHLYLPDSFEGHPLLKSFPLLSREVKPWPGTVDVEGMPSTSNVEAGEAPDGADEPGEEAGEE